MAKKSKRVAAKRARKPKKLVASAKIKAAAKKSAARAAKGAPLRAVRPARKAAKPAVEKITLYGSDHSIPSCKVAVMLSMCGAKWDFRYIDGERRRQPQYQAISKYGQIPVLEHGTRHICQSNTILRHLSEHFGRFAGRSEAEKLRVSEWLDFEADIIAIGLGRARYLKTRPDTSQDFKEFIVRRCDRTFASLDRQLGTTKFLVGAAPTIADIAIFTWIATAEDSGYSVAKWPNVQAWAERMMTFPGAGHPQNIIPKQDRIAA